MGWWSQFAKSGEPGGDWAGLAESGQYLLINTTSRMEYSQTYSGILQQPMLLCLLASNAMCCEGFLRPNGVLAAAVRAGWLQVRQRPAGLHPLTKYTDLRLPV